MRCETSETFGALNEAWLWLGSAHALTVFAVRNKLGCVVRVCAGALQLQRCWQRRGLPSFRVCRTQKCKVRGLNAGSWGSGHAPVLPLCILQCLHGAGWCLLCGNGGAPGMGMELQPSSRGQVPSAWGLSGSLGTSGHPLTRYLFGSGAPRHAGLR